MSEEFGTVSVRRSDRAREIEVLRQHYRRHRETLMQMIGDAPTEILAGEYRRLVHDIEQALIKLDEVEGRPTASGATPVPPPPPRADHDASLRTKTEPGMRPLVTTAPMDEELGSGSYPAADDSDSRSRLVLIVGAALVALILIGWLIWRASSDGKPEPVREGGPVTTTTMAVPDEGPVTPAPPPVENAISVAPVLHDYGVIRKGTRATRQFEIVNNSDEPVSVEVARSGCRCLYYEHAPVIPPKAKESLTVTIDGARAKAGPLRETIRVSAKSSPAAQSSFEVAATIR
jgi:hypothetical protein